MRYTLLFPSCTGSSVQMINALILVTWVLLRRSATPFCSGLYGMVNLTVTPFSLRSLVARYWYLRAVITCIGHGGFLGSATRAPTET
jgi:hypothetical protein